MDLYKRGDEDKVCGDILFALDKMKLSVQRQHRLPSDEHIRRTIVLDLLCPLIIHNEYKVKLENDLLLAKEKLQTAQNAIGVFTKFRMDATTKRAFKNAKKVLRVVDSDHYHKKILHDQYVIMLKIYETKTTDIERYDYNIYMCKEKYSHANHIAGNILYGKRTNIYRYINKICIFCDVMNNIGD